MLNKENGQKIYEEDYMSQIRVIEEQDIAMQTDIIKRDVKDERFLTADVFESLDKKIYLNLYFTQNSVIQYNQSFDLFPKTSIISIT